MAGQGHALDRSRRRKTAGSAALATAMLAGLLAGCSSDQPGPAAPAQAYFDAFRAALATGITNAAQFYAPEAEVDYRAIGYSGTGRGRMAQALRDWHQSAPVAIGGRDITDSVRLEPFEPLYVSLDGALDPVIQPLFYPEWHTLSTFFVTDAGIAQEIYAGSSESGEHLGGIPRSSSEPLAEEYVRAWGAGDADAVGALYAESAVIRDSLRGVTLGRPARIRSAASAASTAEGSLTNALLHTLALPQRGGAADVASGAPVIAPAVFISAPGQSQPVVDRIVLLLDVGLEGACREHIGVALWLDERRLITRDERFHRVDSLDRCWAELPSGAWWEPVPVPDATRFAMTGTTEVTGPPVALWNGTSTREDLLLWALEQFPNAGLPPPDLTSTTFAPPHPDPWTAYGFVKGAPDVVLPSTWAGCPEEGCDAWPAGARTSALMQLALTWLADIDRQAVMASYAEDRGLEWTARRALESEPALVRAAATLVWGLMDEDLPEAGLVAEMSCEELEADFADLTGAMPVRPCPTRK